MAFTAELLKPHLPAIQSSLSQYWWVGCSGGLDSTVLLHALCQLQLPIKLRAIHVNHQISPHANHWELQCKQFCEKLHIDFLAKKVQVNNTGKGIEDAARELRYTVFTQAMAEGDTLLTAHHRDDQAETLLLRLMRGAGPRGLAAMAHVRSLGKGNLYRPLLHFSRAELEDYARQYQLEWVEDESNSDIHYDRNFLRNQVMPLLQQRWPNFSRKWQQTAQLCADNELLIEEIAAADLRVMGLRDERLGTSISLCAFTALSSVRQQNVLRHWLRLYDLRIPEQIHWQQIKQQLIDARKDAEINISWGNVSLRIYRERLFALPTANFLYRKKMDDVKNCDLAVFEFPTAATKIIQMKHGLLQMKRVRAVTHQACLKDNLQTAQIRYRIGGERCKPQGRNHSQTLKRLLQEYELEPWLRDKVPLIYVENELVAVGDLWICAGYGASEGESGYQIKWLL